MKKYEKPEIEVIEIKTADVITTSGGLNEDGEGTFEDVLEWM